MNLDTTITISTSKSRSLYRDIDLPLLRLLCAFHPWPLQVLCQRVGMEPSVLSNVLAAKRPLPARVGKEFLGLLGMRFDGSLDPYHAFVFTEREGLEADLEALLARIFSKIPGVVLLTRLTETGESGAGKRQEQCGVALYDGRFAAVVHGRGLKYVAYDSKGQNWQLRNDSSTDVLMSTSPFPTKLDILKAFAEGEFSSARVTWDDVSVLCEKNGLDPLDVIQLVNDALQRRAGR